MSWNAGMSLRSFLSVAGLVSATLLAGCGGGHVDLLVPVGGKLLVDGKPLDGVVVTFLPDISENLRGGSGTTDESGAFVVTDLAQNKPGLTPGNYTVTYSRMRLPDGSAMPKVDPANPPPPGLIRVETLPGFLTTPNPKDPTRQVVIPEEGNSNLELNASIKKGPGPSGPPSGPG
jgi:hypothetical protein